MTNLMKKWGKEIFAVLGVFLMLTFTLPNVVKNWQDPGGQESGRLNGKKVTAAELSNASHEIALLKNFGLVPQLFAATSTGGEQEDATRWLLLLREASQNGIVANDAEIRGMVQGEGISDTLLASRLSELGLSQQDLRSCVAHAVMVQKDALLAASGTQVSLPEVEFLANEELSTVRMQYATIDGTRGWEKKPEPTADEINKQFGLYKDTVATLPGSETLPPPIDGHTYPFGYKYPNRLKVEYLKFDRGALSGKFQSTREDLEEAYRYYSSHTSEFKKDNANSVTVDSGQKTFDEVRERLVKDQVNARISKFLKRVTDRLLETTKVAWNSAKPDEGGYRELLSADKWGDYKAVAQQLKDSKEFDGYGPEYVQVGKWQDAQALSQDEGIGGAYYETPAGRYPFAQVAMHVKELNPTTSPKDDFPRLFQQVGTDGPLLTDMAGNQYVFRVTDAQTTHSPATVDEVRGQVVEDLKKIAAYKDAQAAGTALAAEAATADLSALAKQHGYAAKTVPEITHVGRDFPDVRGIYGLVNAAFELARSSAAARATQPAGTQAAATQPSAHKTTSVAVDALLSVYAVALDASNPATPTAFAANRQQYAEAAQQEYMRLMVISWVRLEAVMKRMNYVPRTPFAAKEAA